MSTNFYVETNETCVANCPTCGHEIGTERVSLHLGKSSCGWPFLFKMYDGDTLENAYENWLKRLSLGQIVDEYGKPHTIEELLARIDECAKVTATRTVTVYAEWLVDDEGRRWESGEFC